MTKVEKSWDDNSVIKGVDSLQSNEPRSTWDARRNWSVKLITSREE